MFIGPAVVPLDAGLGVDDVTFLGVDDVTFLVVVLWDGVVMFLVVVLWDVVVVA